MTDFGAVVAELRLFHHNVAADAVEALAAENEKLRGQIERDRVKGAEAVLNEQLRTASAEAERDALQQQLDSDNFESMRSRIGALEAVIAAVRESREYDGPTKPYRYDSQAVTNVLDLAPSVVLDGMIREAKAEALDGMTTEWGTKIVSEPGVAGGTEDYARRNVATWNQSGYHKGDMRGVVVSRLVGPWTPVEGDA